MSKIVSESENQIKQAVISAFESAMEKGQLAKSEIPDFRVEIPADRANGDYAVNAAMVSARTFRMAPAKIAQIILDNLDLSKSYAKSAEIAGPGFINFR